MTTTPKAKDTHLGESISLWEAWAEDGLTESRNALLEFYLPWTKQVASGFFAKYRTPGLEWEDFVHCCALGLIDAIGRFDMDAGVPFEAYAYKFLKGSVLRTASSFMREKSAARQQWAGRAADRIPGDVESSDSYDVIVESMVGLAFGYFLEFGVASSNADSGSLSDQYVKDEDFGKIVESVSRLDKTQQFVIRSHYFHYLKFVEIADLMEVSRARVSQIHHAALRKIRKFYEDENP